MLQSHGRFEIWIYRRSPSPRMVRGANSENHYPKAMSEERISIPAVRTWEEQQEHEQQDLKRAAKTAVALIDMDYLAYNQVRLKIDNLLNPAP
jgi:hypothetical protein